MPLRRQKGSTMQVEYRVREIKRFVVTRWHSDGSAAGVETKGEYSNYDTAYEVAYALCRSEHSASGEPPGSMNFIYPGAEPTSITPP
jgi:hypothetical protein